jgi:hypothetical protein
MRGEVTLGEGAPWCLTAPGCDDLTGRGVFYGPANPETPGVRRP